MGPCSGEGCACEDATDDVAIALTARLWRKESGVGYWRGPHTDRRGGLLAQDLDALDDGGAGVVDAVDEGLPGQVG